jgi:pyruvate-ferredoxin/flavodoxin oxidoreductase
MNNGVGSGAPRVAVRAWARDALGAVALAEGAVAERIVTDDAELPLREGDANAFGGAVKIERIDDAVGIVTRAEELASAGERVAIVTGARELASARDELRSIAQNRLGVVAHAVGDVDAGGYADAIALGDIGWGVLFAASAAESLDLALVARRAAEDSGCPFLVVHERGAVRHVEQVAPPSRDLCDAFVGAPSTRVRRVTDGAHPVHAEIGARAFAERVPFALSSAMRELGGLTGRQHDVLERFPATDAQVVLVGVGAVGDSLIAEVDRMRASGHDVGALRVVAMRPFAGARLVKAVSRALVISVLERCDVPLAQSNPLATEVKAAFSDALTWAPDYPGIGRIPRIVSGVVGTEGHELDATDIDAVVENALADERGKRFFALGAGDLARVPGAPSREAPSSFSMRAYVAELDVATACADLAVAVLGSTLGLHASAAVRPLSSSEGRGFAVDVLAGRARPRGAHTPRAVRLVIVDDAATLVASNPLARLARGGAVAVPSAQRSADGVWGELPAWAKAIVFDREASVIAFEGAASTDSAWTRAARVVGLGLVAASRAKERAVDASLVAREVAEAVREALRGRADVEATIVAAADIARRAFDTHVDVPRATIERDEEAVRLGRRDARAQP